ncbi:activating signal cointegrator 1 complex subunit 1-like isoform X2 [Dendronephthya gigantea]|nr:activating signal cointegrator 1 complex subunit 1-like isoform X2 [Dendronephthya gigantea]
MYKFDQYEEDEPECTAIEAVGSGFKTLVAVPVELVKFICGKKMETKLRIERETNTQIKLPRHGVEGPAVITGSRKKDILSCRQKIELIIEWSRQKIPPTHFLSFPLYKKETISRLEDFKSAALETCGESKGLDASIFTKPQTLHQTIVMLTLLTQKEVEAASSLLEECYEEIIRPRVGEDPIKIKLEGVEYMNDDPSKVDVLYAKVHDEDGRLQELANAIMKYFVTKGLGKDGYGRVKLHATVLTTKLRETDKTEQTSRFQSTSNNRRAPIQTSFDAREITEVFKDFVFGEHHVDCIHLSQRGVYDDNGQYHCCKSIPLP